MLLSLFIYYCLYDHKVIINNYDSITMLLDWIGFLRLNALCIVYWWPTDVRENLVIKNLGIYKPAKSFVFVIQWWWRCDPHFVPLQPFHSRCDPRYHIFSYKIWSSFIDYWFMLLMLSHRFNLMLLMLSHRFLNLNSFDVVTSILIYWCWCCHIVSILCYWCCHIDFDL